MNVRLALLAALIAGSCASWARSAAADPCARTLNDYPPPPSETATLTCTWGPPRGGLLLDLSELTDELAAPDAPQPYEGTLLQTIGGVAGSWTYAAGSNICMAARHAGLIPEPEFGAEIRLAIAPGCERYEASARNGIESQAAGPDRRSFFFPAVSDGGCPGTAAYRPDRLVLGRYADTWTAVTSPRDDGSWSCSAYSRAAESDPDDGLWLLVFDNHIRFDPADDIAEDTRVTIAIDGTTFPMALRNGYAFVPLSIAPVARALGTGAEVAVTVDTGTGAPATHRFPLQGFADAFGRIAAECGFDPAAVLGEHP
ncbi:MAG: LCCL domain-containing protein [Alphaproteobacteria bacterium]